MKIFALPANENWICDEIVKDFNKHNSKNIVYNPNDADIIWLVSSWLWRTVPVELLKQKKVVTTVHHIDNDKFNIQDFIARDEYTDHYHVYDELTFQKVKLLTKKPITRLLHWYDKDKYPSFDFEHRKKECRKELDLNYDDYIIGSFQRDTEGHDLSSPKLSKGPDLFCDYVERVHYWTSQFTNKKGVHVLLGGWRRQYVINRLEAKGIPYTYIEMAPQKKLLQMYGALDLYVVSSRTEGGPQAVIECSAMKVPIYSTKVGIASDILHSKCILEPNDFVWNTSIHNDIAKSYVNQHHNTVKEFEIEKHKLNYIEMFIDVMNG